jgi:hypothetical protein
LQSEDAGRFVGLGGSEPLMLSIRSVGAGLYCADRISGIPIVEKLALGI